MRVGFVSGVIGAMATAGAALAYGVPSRAMTLTAVTAAVATLALRKIAGPRARGGAGAHASPMAIVPWGVLVDPDDKYRVLRWPAIKAVSVDMIHANDSGSTSTLWSLVTVETETECFRGRAPGAVPLERLVAHFAAYAAEASHIASLDLAGDEPGEGPLEPEFEPLLESARAYVVGAPASARLDLPPGGYRTATTSAPSPLAVDTLRALLRDRAPKQVDPRAFAAVLAAELRATALADDLIPLVQCPHPLIAAVAKAAAHKLGVATSRTGTLDEVAPFLMERDVVALTAWERGSERL